MRRAAFVSFFLFLLFAAQADTNTVPLLTIGDRTFTNATIRKVNATTVIVRDSGGFGSVHITNLPEAIREKYFDEREAKQQEASAAAARDKATQARQEAATIQIESAKRKAELANKKPLLVRVDKVTQDGFLGTVIIVRQIRESPPSTLTDNQRAGAAVFAPPRLGRVISTEKEERQRVFVSHGPRDIADGKEVSIFGWMTGTKKIDGLTVEQWDCVPSWERSAR